MTNLGKSCKNAKGELFNYWLDSNYRVIIVKGNTIPTEGQSTERNPSENREYLGNVSILNKNRDLYSDGQLVPSITNEEKNAAKTTPYQKEQAQYNTDSEPEKVWTVSELEAGVGKFLNDGNYSANIVADPRYNFNSTDAPNGTKIKNFIEEMGVKNNNATLDITESNLYKGLLASRNLLPPKNEDLFTKTFRFGYYNLAAPLTRVKEYLFFTKPDLNILIRNKETTENDDSMNDVLSEYETLDIKPEGDWILNPGLLTPFWVDMQNSRLRIIKCLQSSFHEDGDKFPDDPFIHLLTNQVNTNLEIPELTADVVETATNRYGTSIFYRGSSEPSDDGLSFSLEFKDTKYLDVYYFFRAYEEYQTAKHLGTTLVNPIYVRDKVLYDQFSVYKIVVDLDMETILYWGKYYGVTPMSLPRDTFSSDTFDNGLSYTIQFKAQFYEDMKPEILVDFNTLTAPIFKPNKTKNNDPNGIKSSYSFNKDPEGTGYNQYSNSGSGLYDLRPYNSILGRIDNRPAITAYISKQRTGKRAQNPNGYIYKLHWRGVDRY